MIYNRSWYNFHIKLVIMDVSSSYNLSNYTFLNIDIIFLPEVCPNLGG